MDKLLSMTVFARTAESGSFAAAARALGMTPQMAGRHVDDLEQHLGVRLLHRSTRSQRLTEAGQAYLEGCRRVLEEAAGADAAARAQAETPNGTVRVTAPVAFGSSRLAPELQAFLSMYPEVTIDLTLTDRRLDLLHDDCDVAFRVGLLPESRWIARALVPYRLVACASPAYVERHGEPRHPKELEHHVCLDYVFDNYPAPQTWTFGDGSGATLATTPRSRLRVNDGRALIAAAEAGAGIVLAGAPNVASALAAGRLVRVLTAYTAPVRPMHLLYLDRRSQAAKQRVFIEWAMARFGDQHPAPHIEP